MSTTLRPCCLVVEDQALIAMAVEDYLDEAGIDTAGPFASCESALAWAQERSPDMALLDFQLKDGPCTEIARTLLQRGVPVVIYSGVPKALGLSPELQGVTWVEKPADRAEVLQALVRATRNTSRGWASGRASFADSLVL
jgi:DNA-binding response OmpR family regulator